MLLFLAILLVLVFGGLGFALHVLWWGLILAVIVGVAHALTSRRSV
jgi:hypothetical protein